VALTPDAVRGRADRLRALMADRGLEAVVVYAAQPGTGILSTTSGNTVYLADWSHPVAPTVLVLTADGEADLWSASYAHGWEWARTKPVWVERLHDIVDPASIRAVLGEAKLEGARVGLIGRSEMTVSFHAALVGDEDRWAFEDADDLLVRLKRERDDDEIELGRRAVENAEAMLEAVVEGIRREKKVFEIAADARHAARLRGSDWTDIWLGPAPNGLDVAQVSWQGDRRVQPGDLVQIVAFNAYRGRFAQLLRTGVKGKASPEVRHWVEVSMEAQQRALDTLRPGISMFDVVDAAQDALTELAPFRFGEDPYATRTGHRQGVQYAEPVDSDPFLGYLLPDRSVLEPVTVCEGMRLVVHPNFSVPGVGWFAVGDNMLVTADGAELLGEFPRECFEV
jgi:Xaa-Pro dipeptidase